MIPCFLLRRGFYYQDETADMEIKIIGGFVRIKYYTGFLLGMQLKSVDSRLAPKGLCHCTSFP